MLPRIVLRAGYGLFYDRLSNQLGLLESRSRLPNYDPTRTARTHRAGPGAQINAERIARKPVPDAPAGQPVPAAARALLLIAPPLAVTPLSINDIDPKIRTPYYQQYGAEHPGADHFATAMLEVGYVGARGIALPVETEINQAHRSRRSLNAGQRPDDDHDRQRRRPLALPGLLEQRPAVPADEQLRRTYNSLQGTLISEVRPHSEMVATYTWSHSLDDRFRQLATAPTSTTLSRDQTQPSQAHVCSSDFDRTHHLAVRFVYDVPRLHRGLFAKHVVSGFVNGYNVSGVVVAQSGLPFSITNTGGATYYGTDTSLASYAPGRTAASALYGGSPESRLLKYFDTSAFVGSGTGYGNTGRNILRGSFQRNVDLALNKRTAIHDSLVSEFRLQAFNVFNMVNFANPGNDEGTAATYGIIGNTTGNPRILQLSLKLEF